MALAAHRHLVRPDHGLALALLAAGLLHAVVWWGWVQRGWTGSASVVLPVAVMRSAATSAAVPVQLGASPGVVRARSGQSAGLHVNANPGAQAQSALVRATAPERRPSVADQAMQQQAVPMGGAERVPGDADARSQDGRMWVGEPSVPEASPTQAGAQWLTGPYAPADTLDQSPRPELGWFLDEDVLTPLLHGRMLVQLWVSAEGRIDRAELLQAEPPGEWALRALRPLPGTPMRAGVRAGRPVAATLVVELVTDNERFR